METIQVTSSATARTRPAEITFYYSSRAVEKYYHEPVKSDELKTMFKSKLGRLHTIDNAKVRTPAVSRRKSTNAHEPINFFDGISVVFGGLLDFVLS